MRVFLALSSNGLFSLLSINLSKSGYILICFIFEVCFSYTVCVCLWFFLLTLLFFCWEKKQIPFCLIPNIFHLFSILTIAWNPFYSIKVHLFGFPVWNICFVLRPCIFPLEFQIAIYVYCFSTLSLFYLAFFFFKLPFILSSIRHPYYPVLSLNTHTRTPLSWNS